MNSPDRGRARGTDVDPTGDQTRREDDGQVQHHDHDHDQDNGRDHGHGEADRRSAAEQEKERFGGMKFGACFFGWLTATGTAVLLTASLGAAGAALGSNTNATPGTAADNASAIGLAGGIALLAVVLVAHLAGGYVAGRMARFSGLKQGVGVWLWAIIIAVVVAVLGLVVGDQSDVAAGLDGVPRIPINADSLTAGAIIVAIGVVVVSLVGAILGGLAGMRFHRKVEILFATLERSEAANLEGIFTKEELLVALKDLNGDKAPRPYGFSVAF